VPRHKTPIAEKKLKGLYREDRHGNSAEEVINELIKIPENIVTPSTLTDPYVQSYFSYHTEYLIKIGILSLSDLPELENMYISLQKLREINVKLNMLDMVKDIDTWNKLSSAYIKYSNHFSSLAGKYYISPTARAKMTYDQLNIKKLESEIPSLTERLLKKKRS